MKDKKSFPFSYIFGIILSALIIIVIIYKLRHPFDSYVPTINSFFTMITTSPYFDISESFKIGHISKLTGVSILDFLYSILNGLIDIVNFLVFLGSSFINILSYIAYFIKWLFGF